MDNRKNRKKYLPLVVLVGFLFMVNGIFALYYFANFTFIFDVMEPFDVYYANVNESDEGLYNSVEGLGCGLHDSYLDWEDLGDLSTTFDLEDKYPGDEGIICFKFISNVDEDIEIDSELNGDFGDDISGNLSYDDSNVVPSNSEMFITLKYGVGSSSSGSYSLVVDFSR